MASFKVSSQTQKKVKQARNNDGRSIDDPDWLTEASQVLEPDTNWSKYDTQYASGVSLATWKRFLEGKAIRPKTFKAFCAVLNLNWQEIRADCLE
jgi:hypothetical protein